MDHNYQCIGCGALIQTEDPASMGFLPASALAKGQEKGEFYCQRCFKLRHYNELKDVQIDDDVFIDKLNSIAENEAFVILVVDIFDVEGSIISGLDRFIGHQPFIVAGNKIDLLPKVTRHSKLKDWLRQMMNRHQLFPQDVILTHGNKQAGIESLVQVIKQEIMRRDVYIVGVTNVGKSTLINQLIHYFGGDKEIITTSNHPGTTLDLIRIPLTADHAVYDTPGIVRRHQLAHEVSRADMKTILPQHPIKARTFQLKEGQTIFMAGVARVDIIDGQEESTSITFYVDNQLYLHRTKTENAEEIYANHLGQLLSPPSQEYLDEFPPLQERSFKLNGQEDISISGLGWFTSNLPVKINVWTPQGISVTKRISII